VGAAVPGTAFSIDHGDRRIEVIPDSLWEKDRVRLLVDGAVVAETKTDGPRTKLVGGDVEVRVVMPWWGGSIKRAELVRDGGPALRLRPAPGTRAARRDAFERAHPRLFAARHVARGVTKALLAVVGVAFLFRLVLPAIPWPDIDLPDIPWPLVDLPEIPWPSIDLPDVALPAWVREVLNSAKIWGPILVGVVLAVRELRRRRRTAEAPEQRDADLPPPPPRRSAEAPEQGGVDLPPPPPRRAAEAPGRGGADPPKGP
jgi:hypothetical protein